MNTLITQSPPTTPMQMASLPILSVMVCSLTGISSWFCHFSTIIFLTGFSSASYIQVQHFLFKNPFQWASLSLAVPRSDAHAPVIVLTRQMGF